MKTEKELFEIAEKIAKETIFVGVEDSGIKWRGYHVFDPIVKESPNGEIPCIGLPQFILLDEDGNKYKENLSYEETFEICRLFPDYETDEGEEFEDEV